MPKPPTLGERLLAWRRDRKLSQPEAARELGVPFRTYQDTERDYHRPRGFGLAMLEKMLAAHETSKKNPI